MSNLIINTDDMPNACCGTCKHNGGCENYQIKKKNEWLCGLYEKGGKAVEQLDLFENQISDREWYWNATGQELIANKDHPNHCNEYEDSEDCTNWVRNTCFGCKHIDKCREEFSRKENK